MKTRMPGAITAVTGMATITAIITRVIAGGVTENQGARNCVAPSRPFLLK